MTSDRRRRDRTGEWIEDEEPHEDTAHECFDGWLNDRLEAEHPAPCLVCRPHLRRQVTGRPWQARP